MSENPSRVRINPVNLRGMTYLLGTIGQQSAPDYVDQSAVIPVVDVGMNGYARLNDYSNLLYCRENEGVNLAGVQTKTVRVISYVINDGSGDEQIVVPNDHNLVIWGWKMYVYTNAAGAAALNQKYMSMEVTMSVPIGGIDIEITKYHGTGHCSTNVLLYAPGHYEFAPLNRNDLYIIPRTCFVEATVWLQDGTNFPANTSLYYTIVGQPFPVGMAVPWGI